MADPTAQGVPTDNYGFQKPTVGADEDLWGNDYTTGDPAVDPSPGLNGNWSKADVLLKAMQDEIDQLKLDVEARKIPIGGLYISVTPDDDTPEKVAARLGYGTWIAFGAGRVLTCVGNNGESTVTRNGGYGSDNVTLAESQIPSHRHLHDPTAQTFTTTSSGSHSHATGAGGSFLVGQQGVGTSGYDSGNQYPNITARTSTGTDGAHTHTVSVNLGAEWTNYTGGGGAHTNRQRGIGVLVYQRTA